MSDKYSAVWVSHSSLGDFLKCPRLYYLHNVYKDPMTRHKINIVAPALSLGQAVHGVLEPLRELPVAERFSRDLLADFEREWKKVSGKQGGFVTAEEESNMKARGKSMIERVLAHPGPLAKKTVRLTQGTMLPNFYLSEEENIILCGLIDWIEYIEEDDSVRILDFKTGKNDEGDDSLQLPIYLLLLNALQKRPVSGADYWYLERDDVPTPKTLPDISVAREEVLALARRVKEVRIKKEFICPRGEHGCFACRPFEAILKGEAEYVGVGGYNQDQYCIS